jgi:XTP/dITP diphosphohydrolase
LSISKLLLATNNRAKVEEYKRLLLGISYTIVNLADVGIETIVDETGATFEENAALKAKIYANLSKLLTMADDSGLEVDVLGGQPGVLSARYAGEKATDKERIDFLLAKLRDTPWEKRTARFKCIIAIASSEEEVELFTGECQGIIAFKPSGEKGFGYDPIFYLPRLGKTMAELSMDEKNEISHRGQAVIKARRILE